MSCWSVFSPIAEQESKLAENNPCSIIRNTPRPSGQDHGCVATNQIRRRSYQAAQRKLTKQKTRGLGTSITQLPPELLLKIFSELGPEELSHSVAPVCRAWHGIAHDHTLWHSVAFRGMDASTERVVNLLGSKPRLKALTLCERSDLNQILTQLADSNTSLEHLYMYRCRGRPDRLNVRSDVMVRVLRRCKKLQSIVIEETQFRSCQFYKILLPKISKEVKFLRMIVRPSVKEWKILTRAKHLYKLKIRAH